MYKKTLRDYQEDAIEQAYRSLYVYGYPGTIMHLFTGAGKTFIAANFVMKYANPLDHRVLFLVNRTDLVGQGRDAFIEHFPQLQYDYDNAIGVVMNEYDECDASIVFATPQTLANKMGDDPRMARVLEHGAFDLIISDECHYSVSRYYLNLFAQVRKQNPYCKVLGLTATPVRSDGKALSQVYTDICITRDVLWGIENGHLCPVKVLDVETNLTLPDGEGSIEARSRLIDVDNYAKLIVDSYVKHGEGRSAIFFMNSVEQSARLAEEFIEHGIEAVHVEALTSKPIREAAYKRFRNGELKVLTNYEVLTMGFDAPICSLIGLARITENPVTHTQILGRGLRLHPDKQDCLVLNYSLGDIELVHSGVLHGVLTPKAKDPILPIEDQEEIITLHDGILLDDMNTQQGYVVTGSGLLVKRSKLGKRRPHAWMIDSRGDADSLSASFSYPKGGENLRNLVFVIMLPNYTEAKQLAQRIAKGEEFLQSNPDHPTAKRVLASLKKLYNIVSQYTFWDVEKIDGKWTVSPSPRFSEDTYEELLDSSSVYVARNTSPIAAKKSKSWRREPATEGQIGLLRKLCGGELPSDVQLTKGEVAKAITHYIAVPKVREVIDKLRKEVAH